MYEHFFTMITGQDYNKTLDAARAQAHEQAEAKVAAEKAAAVEATKGRRRRKRHADAKDDALDLAEDLNLDRVGRDHSSDSDLLDSEGSIEVDDRDLSASELAKKRRR